MDNAHPTALSGNAFSNFALFAGEKKKDSDSEMPSADLFGRVYPATPTTNKVYINRQCVTEFATGVYEVLNHHIFQVVKEVNGKLLLLFTFVFFV